MAATLTVKTTEGVFTDVYVMDGDERIGWETGSDVVEFTSGDDLYLFGTATLVSLIYRAEV